MNRQSYYIMSADTPVTERSDNKLIVIDDTLLPLFFRRSHNVEDWLASRAIDHKRPNARLLKKALRLKEKDDVSTAMHVNGATITDNYWIKSFDSELTYANVKFRDDRFAQLALKGAYDCFVRAASAKNTHTPELTNTGSFEKCWRLIDGRWWMYKSANHDEMFSELFIARFGVALGMNMAVYERGDKCVKTLDFTDSTCAEGASVNFKPASSFMDDNDYYENVVAKLQEICPQAIPDYVRMIFLDTIVANLDRQTANFGLLRDTKTGELLGLAPLFDHNMALIARGYPKAPKKTDLLIRLFNKLMDNHPQYKEYLPEVTEEAIKTTITNLHMRVRTNDIVSYILNRYQLISMENDS